MLRVTGKKSGPDGAAVCAVQVYSMTEQLRSQLLCAVPNTDLFSAHVNIFRSTFTQ